MLENFLKLETRRRANVAPKSEQSIHQSADEALVPSDEFWEANAVNSTLRATLILLIVVVIIFAVTQIIKLVLQIQLLKKSADAVRFINLKSKKFFIKAI